MTATKVTLSLPDDLLAGVDRYVAEHTGVTRSGVAADALREWLRERYEAQIAEYYGSLADEERAEDRAWSAMAAASAACSWR